METLNIRAGFLCNHEVLAILRQQRDARSKQVRDLNDAKLKRVALLGRKPFGKEQEDDERDRIQPQDLHTVTFECIKYLEESVHPLRRQTTSSINKLLQELERLDLTKAERLQIINLAPTTLVALVMCVEDFEERFPHPDDQAHILTLIKDHLGDEDAATTTHAAGLVSKEEPVEADEMDEDTYAEVEENEGLIDEGTGQGGMEDVGKELDEEDA